MIVNGAEKKENIIIYNARENNLKNITVKFPLNKITCVTGPSGCGKSSLVFDTLFAESQRTFWESLSGNMFGQKLMDKPKVNHIENLHPALNLSQKYYNVNPRSTVGTITDISYYLRTLYTLLFRSVINEQADINYFSPNNPSSCCPHCHGLGEEYIISEKSLMPDTEKTLSNGGILYYKGAKSSREHKLLEAICTFYGIDINKKIQDLTSEEKHHLLYRTTPHTFHLRYKTLKGKYKQATVSECGALVELNKKLEEINIPSTFTSISKYLEKRTCSICHGQKMNSKIRGMKICELNIGNVEQLPIYQLKNWCKEVANSYQQSIYHDQILQLLSSINKRVQHLIDLNLEYINIGRSIPTLSSGELQRVRLATQLDCSLNGLVYILDEPCKGLHYQNIDAIINSIHALSQRGNTIIAIEHNKQFINAANYIVKMGPGGGPNGGQILSAGENIPKDPYILRFKIPRIPSKHISIRGITYRNLKHLDVQIPIGCITCISGVSGSGKSSLADVIEQCCIRGENEFCSSTSGITPIKRVLRIDQRPIGKTARSTVASYLGIYDIIRDAFAQTPDALQQGLNASAFSMNVPGGRCECCQGTGKQKIELSYLPSAYVICPECKGKRFHQEVLSIKYNGYSIDDILNLNIHSLIPIFKDLKQVYKMLQCLDEIGLGYISLGQMSMNLSGGEAQRIKLAKYLGASFKGTNMYILDEPTSGLSSNDIERLSKIIDKLANCGETIIIIEHNIEFISQMADFLIDLGNIAGNAGGNTIIEGNVQQVMQTINSSWFSFLKSKITIKSIDNLT